MGVWCVALNAYGIDSVGVGLLACLLLLLPLFFPPFSFLPVVELRGIQLLFSWQFGSLTLAIRLVSRCVVYP